MTLPRVVGPYSLYKKVGSHIYISGQIGINPEIEKLEDGFGRQAQRACENIKAICEDAEIEMSDICKTTIFLTDMHDYERLNSIYSMYFSHAPARSCIVVKELPAGALVEIEAIAYKN